MGGDNTEDQSGVTEPEQQELSADQQYIEVLAAKAELRRGEIEAGRSDVEQLTQGDVDKAVGTLMKEGEDDLANALTAAALNAEMADQNPDIDFTETFKQDLEVITSQVEKKGDDLTEEASQAVATALESVLEAQNIAQRQAVEREAPDNVSLEGAEQSVESLGNAHQGMERDDGPEISSQGEDKSQGR